MPERSAPRRARQVISNTAMTATRATRSTATSPGDHMPPVGVFQHEDGTRGVIFGRALPSLATARGTLGRVVANSAAGFRNADPTFAEQASRRARHPHWLLWHPTAGGSAEACLLEEL